MADRELDRVSDYVGDVAFFVPDLVESQQIGVEPAGGRDVIAAGVEEECARRHSESLRVLNVRMRGPIGCTLLNWVHGR